MAVFAYKANDSKQARVTGSITADTARLAREQLRAQGLTVHQLTPFSPTRGADKGGFRIPGQFGLRRRYSHQVSSMVRELSTLLGVGIPLLEALQTITRQRTGGFQRCLQALYEQIAAGNGLAAAMRMQPDLFDNLSVNMVEVGETAGNLDEVLQQLADFKEQSAQFRDRVVSALLYPAIVLGISFGVTIFLMTVVVPMLLTNLLEAGRTLPWPTRVLKILSDGLLQHGLWLVCAFMGVALLCTLVLRTDSGRRWWYRYLMRLPLVGGMEKKQSIARAALLISVLLRSGIVFDKALEITMQSIGNLIVRDALQVCQVQVRAGRDIGIALENAQAFPPLVVQIFSVGQQTGRLEEMLERLANDYDRQVKSTSDRLSTAIEPLLILFLAIVVGFILFATILPILEAGNVL